MTAAPDIIYFADRDGDGTAEVREVLFTGFKTGALERGINAPVWFVDGWIYAGRGHGGISTVRQIHRNIKFSGKPGDTADMVIVLVGHQYGVQTGRLQTQAGQTALGLRGAETAVQQQP